jgi:hypothetical protein
MSSGNIPMFGYFEVDGWRVHQFDAVDRSHRIAVYHFKPIAGLSDKETKKMPDIGGVCGFDSQTSAMLLQNTGSSPFGSSGLLGEVLILNE